MLNQGNPESSMRVILISPHHINSRRRAGFHWIANAFAKINWEIVFVTAPIRYTAWFLGDHRTQYFSFRDVKKLKKTPNPNIQSYVFMTLFNPISSNKKLLAYLSIPLRRFYGKLLPSNLNQIISSAGVIIFESSEALFLFDAIRRINGTAKYVYRVSDDLAVIHAPQSVIDYEQKIAPKFDLISVPSEYIYRKFAHLPNVRLHYHGINKELFSKQHDRPREYAMFEKNIVFVGTSHFDYDFIITAAESFPRWGFHIIGPLAKRGESSNLLYYGEMPFAKTVPYIQHADVGLQNRISDHGLASLSDSLKVLQYTYCKLPIVAPVGLQSSRKNFVYYVPGDEDSIMAALERAVEYDRRSIDSSNIHSWDELAELLIEGVYKE